MGRTKGKSADFDEKSADFIGTAEGIRTPDLLVRSQTLYPAELRGLEQYEVYEKSFFTSTDFDDRDIRRRSLYPSELRKRVLNCV